MKRLIAAVLCLSILALCACSKNETVEEIQTSVTESTTHPNTFTEWDSELVPENFPKPQPGMHDLEITTGSAGENGYRSDYVRLTFICFEKDIYEFSNSLSECGYVGGVKNIPSPAAYYAEGFTGNWHDGKKLVTINGYEVLSTGEVKFVFDIIDCIESFPEALEPIFPKFVGYSKTAPTYRLYNSKGEVVSEEFSGILGEGGWFWDFGFENAMVGVTMEQLNQYEIEMVDAGFGGNCITTYTDGCTVISYDMTKMIDGKIHGIYIAYNQSLKTMDVVYTNDISLVTGE